MRVSVIATVLNEGDSIRVLLNSLVEQTRSPDEIVIVDGGSSDNTVPIIESYRCQLPVRLLLEPGCNISQGRNRAIRAATGNVIASTDAGVRLEPDWLAQLVSPFDVSETPVGVVSGFFVADPETVFEIAMGAAVLPTVSEIDADKFLPSSRSVAYTRDAWELTGGYPEWLDYSEDLVFDLTLRELGVPFDWAPRAVVHFRPRGTMSSFFRQYYRYARGDGKADLWRRRHAVRYAAYFVALPGLVLLSLVNRLEWLLPLAAGVVAHCWTPWLRLRMMASELSAAQALHVALLVPLIRLVGDVAKMIGYPVGWMWRLRHWQSREIHWRSRIGSGPDD
jgi:glycosyltransferase involved in cell wall biosynthesis